MVQQEITVVAYLLGREKVVLEAVMEPQFRVLVYREELVENMVAVVVPRHIIVEVMVALVQFVSFGPD
jgi:hypothetical protein